MWYSKDYTTGWGEYPPHFYGGETIQKSKSIWERKSTYLAIGAGIIGLVIFVFRIILELSEWQIVLLDGIGVAFITTFLLALIVDIATRKEILDDVVEASLGYILPPSLRPGMRWIYNQKIVCVKHEQTVNILPNPEDEKTVIVRTTLNRTFINVSNAPVMIDIGASVDELFAEGGKSDIFEMGYRIGDRRVELQNQKRKAGHARLVIDAVKEEIPTGDTRLITWLISQEIRNKNDNQDWFFSYATQEPEVTVTKPDNIGYDVGFQYIEDKDTAPVLLSKNKWKLPTTLLPKQAINIRWWALERAEKWQDPKK